jgi:hypothetical protein
MDQKIPFTSYDFWAYLSAGFLLLFAVDQAAGTKLLMRDTWTIVQGVIAVSMAYVVGQLVASVSSFVFEKMLVGKVLGYPRMNLFGKPKAWRWLRALMPDYFAPLPEQTQKAVLERGQKVGADGAGEALFWPAHAYGRSTPAVAARMDNFLNLYGFCRNIALVGLIDAALLYWSYLRPDGPAEHLLWARVAFVIGIGMTFRYLKFFRHFALEVFTSFAFSKEERKAP